MFVLCGFFKGAGGGSGGSGGSGISKNKNRIREFNKKSMCIRNDKCLLINIEGRRLHLFFQWQAPVLTQSTTVLLTAPLSAPIHSTTSGSPRTVLTPVTNVSYFSNARSRLQ